MGRHPTAARVFVTALLVAGTVPLTVVAEADTRGVSDRAGDSAARLDVRSISNGHKGKNFFHEVSMYQAFPSSALTDLIAIFVFDLNNDPDDGADFAIAARWDGDRLIGELFEGLGGAPTGRVPASRPDAHSVGVVVPRDLIGDSPGYGWAGGSVDLQCECSDSAPNEHTFVHDFTKPEIALTSVPDPSTTTSTEESFEIQFSVGDEGFSGIKGWKVVRRIAGSTRWSIVKKGSGGEDQTVTIPGRQGAHYELRVVASDRGGNTTRSPVKNISVPLDDGNDKLADAFATGWSEGGTTVDYLGTLHSSSVAGATFTHAFTGGYVAWIGPGGVGTATVSIDGGDPEVVNLATFTGPRQLLFAAELDRGPHEITIISLTGIVSIDGIVTR